MPSTTEKQQKFFRLVMAYKLGKIKDVNDEVKKAAESMTVDQIRHYLILETEADKLISKHFSTSYTHS